MKLTKNEQERLEALKSYSILDTPEEQEFDALVKLASQICRTSISQINFLDAERQWNKASYPATPKEMKRGETFCSETIHKDEWMIVEDAKKDQRFTDLPYVKNDPNVKFYAGVNLKSEDGYNIGTICVLGFEPKQLEDWQLESLKTLAQEVEARLELRKKQNELEKKTAELERQTTFLENATDLVFILDPNDYSISSINNKLEKVLGYKSDNFVGKPLTDFTDSDSLKQQMDAWLQNSSSVFKGEFKLLNRSGKPVWLEIHMTRKQDELYATAKNITQRKLQKIKIEESLEEKNVLLGEIHHRVKNNLAVISAMLQLELFETDNKQVQNIIQNSQLRIQSMSEVHELLYQTGDFANVNLGVFVHKLIDNIKSVYNTDGRDIKLNTSIDEVSININQAIPIALIINELITNAYKHAFAEKDSGQITVEITQADNIIVLKVSDNGIGMPDNFSLENQSTIGFLLIYQLTDQLEADLELKRNNGSTFQLSFEQKDLKGSSSSAKLENISD
ncbi:MAG: histidine kinase dimerization/phosphoacceptor domain -containing protein [Balneolaceae bacterium]|nr:histidine kinase dimerization/phosphoacceptor domain -containing protein [Balneolaceae bacterium]